ncbi:unnamed protein product [Peniophora sp. CBMAI 1063]|nr:unnamed protein product [Peniophora sp. CBMAI 1063]
MSDSSVPNLRSIGTSVSRDNGEIGGKDNSLPDSGSVCSPEMVPDTGSLATVERSARGSGTPESDSSASVQATAGSPTSPLTRFLDFYEDDAQSSPSSESERSSSSESAQRGTDSPAPSNICERCHQNLDTPIPIPVPVLRHPRFKTARRGRFPPYTSRTSNVGRRSTDDASDSGADDDSDSGAYDDSDDNSDDNSDNNSDNNFDDNSDSGADDDPDNGADALSDRQNSQDSDEHSAGDDLEVGADALGQSDGGGSYNGTSASADSEGNEGGIGTPNTGIGDAARVRDPRSPPPSYEEAVSSAGALSSLRPMSYAEAVSTAGALSSLRSMSYADALSSILSGRRLVHPVERQPPATMPPAWQGGTDASSSTSRLTAVSSRVRHRHAPSDDEVEAARNRAEAGPAPKRMRRDDWN